MIKHTPTPWKIGYPNEKTGSIPILGRDKDKNEGFVVAICDKETTQGDLEYIVRAVNCYESFLSALKEASCQLHGNLGDLTDHFEIKHTKGVIDTIEQAILEAERTA